MADFSSQDNFYARLDRLRRRLGAQLDAMGLGPLETPWRRVFAGDGFTLRGYARTGRGPALLLVPAPIKQAYLWDLAPWASVVRRCLGAGVQVYL
ncbi:MAG: alpha/beta hydrolase, partial [Pseudomonadota bacterium]|nr:alpha/beta hydrolase [Pseudomonadota bacterium]